MDFSKTKCDFNFHVGGLTGKRLLVLGCSNNAADIHEFADEEGVLIISAGLKVSEKIKVIADECYSIDVLDKKQLIEFIREYKIDGIFVGGSEDLISMVIDVATETGLPFYSSRFLWDTLMNKQSFKDTCRKYGVPTPADYKVREDHLEEDSKKLTYPVVIKPVDSSGANGVLKCERQEDFHEMYLMSKSKSKSGTVTVESFVDGDTIGVYYTFVDGKVTMSSMHDKYCRAIPGTFIPLSEIYAYPSKYLPEYQTEMDRKVRNMLTDFGIKNGIANMQGFYDHGTFRFIEIGYRLGGTAQYHYTKYLTGFSSFHMMMAFALTGKMEGCDQNLDNPQFPKPCCTLSLLSKGGTIARTEGLDVVNGLPEVINYEERYKIGDTIKASRTVAQFHYRFFLVADSVEKMKEVINIIQTTVKAYDTNGDSMLITQFDTNKLTFGANQFK